MTAEVFRYWLQNLGDPTVVGWLCTVAYFGAAIACLSAWRSVRPEDRLNAHWFWGGTIAVLLSLGLNKQLDFQIIVLGEIRLLEAVDAVRPWWKWRWVAAGLVFVLVSVVLFLWFFAVRRLKGVDRWSRVLVVAVVALPILMMLRAAPGPWSRVLNFHIIGGPYGGWHTHFRDLLELGLISAVAVAAGRLSTRRNEPPVSAGKTFQSTTSR